MTPATPVLHISLVCSYSKVWPGWRAPRLPRALAVAANSESSSACWACIRATCCSNFRRCSSCFRWAPRKAKTRELKGRGEAWLRRLAAAGAAVLGGGSPRRTCEPGTALGPAPRSARAGCVPSEPSVPAAAAATAAVRAAPPRCRGERAAQPLPPDPPARLRTAESAVCPPRPPGGALTAPGMRTAPGTRSPSPTLCPAGHQGGHEGPKGGGRERRDRLFFQVGFPCAALALAL